MSYIKLDFLDLEETDEYTDTIDLVIDECFKEERLENLNLYVAVTLTTPDEIKKINKEYRNIDKETDVLSFPMFQKEEIDEIVKKQEKRVVLDALGDMVISIERVEEQAKEYGHSFTRELAYMVVHSFYHLMGYDHMEEDEKKVMREKEENILNKLNIQR